MKKNQNKSPSRKQGSLRNRLSLSPGCIPLNASLYMKNFLRKQLFPIPLEIGNKYYCLTLRNTVQSNATATLLRLNGYLHFQGSDRKARPFANLGFRRQNRLFYYCRSTKRQLLAQILKIHLYIYFRTLI